MCLINPLGATQDFSRSTSLREAVIWLITLAAKRQNIGFTIDCGQSFHLHPFDCDATLFTWAPDRGTARNWKTPQGAVRASILESTFLIFLANRCSITTWNTIHSLVWRSLHIDIKRSIDNNLIARVKIYCWKCIWQAWRRRCSHYCGRKRSTTLPPPPRPDRCQRQNSKRCLMFPNSFLWDFFLFNVELYHSPSFRYDKYFSSIRINGTGMTNPMKGV